jgi:putative endonuclease
VFPVIPSGERNLPPDRRHGVGDFDMQSYFVYIMTNRSGTLYTGVTRNLEGRVLQHRSKSVSGFTKRYNITRLVYYEVFSNVHDAIAREKQIKGWRREKKIVLIDSINPDWQDLSEGW